MKICIFLTIMFLVVATSGCEVVRFFSPVDQIIATDFDVTPEWKEIKPEQPMTAPHRIKMIYLKVEGAKLPEAMVDQNANTASRNWSALILPDGETAVPEVILIDESGREHVLHGSQESVDGRGYSADSTEMADLKFVSLKIRSDVPFKASEVRWRAYEPK